MVLFGTQLLGPGCVFFSRLGNFSAIISSNNFFGKDVLSPSKIPISSLQLSCSVMLDTLRIPWTAARQASLSITNSQSLLKLMSIESVIPSNHLIFCRPLLLLPSIFPSIRVFSKVSIFVSGGQSIRVSAAASVLPMNIQD